MKNKIIKLSKNNLVRNIMIIASGTAAAQVITMAFSPFITRLYGPESFGVLGVFMALVGIISPVAALTYPIAIVLPKNDADAKILIRISIFISVIISIIITIILFFFHKPIIKLLGIEAIASYLYLIPLVILFAALLEVVQQWLIRTKQFSVIARVSLLQSLFLNSSKVGIGWFYPMTSVLIILGALGSAVHAFMLFIGARRIGKYENEKRYKPASSVELAKKYKDFPLYRAPQVFINAVSQSLPILLLASFLGPATAGFYSLSKTVLGVPSLLIGKSVGDVFYPRIAEAVNNRENLTNLIMKATLALAAVGIFPYGIIVILGPWIFEFVFGEEWIKAGEYARWLALWSFFGFINRPSVKSIPVLNLQGFFLFYEILSIIIRIGVLYLGLYIYNNDIYAIILFSLASVVLNFYLIIYTIKKSKYFYN